MGNIQTIVQSPNGASSKAAPTVVSKKSRCGYLSQLPQTLYDVMVERIGSTYMARVLFWPQEVIVAETRADALDRAQALILKHLSQSEFVTISIDPQTIADLSENGAEEQLEKEDENSNDAQTGENHPWAPFAGMYKDYPEELEEMRAEIARYRDEIDREMGMGKYMEEDEPEQLEVEPIHMETRENIEENFKEPVLT